MICEWPQVECHRIWILQPEVTLNGTARGLGSLAAAHWVVVLGTDAELPLEAKV